MQYWVKSTNFEFLTLYDLLNFVIHFYINTCKDPNILNLTVYELLVRQPK